MRLKMQRNETRHNRDSPFFAAALFVRRCNFFLSLMYYLREFLSVIFFLSFFIYTLQFHLLAALREIHIKGMQKKWNEMKYNKELHWMKRKKNEP